MLLSVVGMIWGLAKQKQGVMWGKPLATVAALVALVCALAQIFAGGGQSSGKIMAIQMRYLRVSTERLGEYLAEKYPGSKAVVVITPPSKYAAQSANVLVEGLKKGLAGKVEILAEIAPEMPKMPMMPGGMMPPPPPGGAPAPGAGDAKAPPGAPSPEEMMMMGPPEFWLTAERFDAMLQPYIGKADIVITTIGLPMDMPKMKFWTLNPRPKMVIASGSIFELRKAIEAGAVAAAITYNPKAQYDNKAPPSKLDDAFNKRFLLVTPESVEQIAKDHPELFMQEQKKE